MAPQKILVSITADDINVANRTRPLDPLIITLLRDPLLDFKNVIALPKMRTLWVDGKYLYRIPKIGTAFLEQYEAYRPLQPISFQIIRIFPLPEIC